MDYIKLMRPKHYIKNLLIFLPLIFSGLLLNINNFTKTLLGFLIFCLVASVIYIINDINDREKDRQHAVKKNRPIASGKVSVKNAIIEIILLLVVSIFLIVMFKLPIASLTFLTLYFIINLGYSNGLKNIPVVDILLLVSGFVLRVLYGASILNITVSNWLYLTILAASFYLGLGKRRNEIQKNGDKTRNVLKYYTQDYLDKNMYMFLCMAIIFYSLWATDVNLVNKSNNLLIWSVPIVITICLKYNMNIENDSYGDPVEVILEDKIILLLGLILGLYIFLVLYIF